MKVEIDMSELTDFAELLEQAPKQAKAAVRRAVVKEGRAAKSRAIAAAPRGRPWLSSHIRSKTWTNPDSVAVSIFADLYDERGRAVAVFVEHGTSVMPPNPFMRTAIAPAESTLGPAVLAEVDPLSTDTSEGPDE